jgi:hypothetical protein
MVLRITWVAKWAEAFPKTGSSYDPSIRKEGLIVMRESKGSV